MSIGKEERYAKVEVMSSSLVEQSKMNEVIVARTASSIVWLVCACQGCPQPNKALRAGFLVCGSTVDSARRAGEFASRISRRDLWPNAMTFSGQQCEHSGNKSCGGIRRGLRRRVMALCNLSDICRATRSKNPPGLFALAELQPAIFA